MVEFASPVLLSVPVTVGVNVRMLAPGTMVMPNVSPLNESVDVECVMSCVVVVA
jgi:hypothetical protein